MKISLIVISLFTLNHFIFSQDKIDEKYTHYYKEKGDFKNENVVIDIKNIAARYNYFKFAFKLKNSSSDYLIYDNAKSKMVFDWGKAYLKKSKIYFLKPGKSESEVFDVNDDIRFLKEEAKFVIEGLVKVPFRGKVQPISNTLIDAELKTELNKVNVSFKKVEIKLKKSLIQFKITNNSDDYVILIPSQLQVKVAEGVNLNNNVSVKKTILVKPGKTKLVSFSFDLLENQDYFSYKAKTVIFNDFLEISHPIQLDPIEFIFELDREVTYKMNK